MPRSLFLLGEVLFVVDDKRDKSRDDDRDNDDPEIEQRGSSAAAAVAGALVSARRIRIGRNGGIGCTGSFNGIGGDLGFGRGLRGLVLGYVAALGGLARLGRSRGDGRIDRLRGILRGGDTCQSDGKSNACASEGEDDLLGVLGDLFGRIGEVSVGNYLLMWYSPQMCIVRNALSIAL